MSTFRIASDAPSPEASSAAVARSPRADTAVRPPVAQRLVAVDMLKGCSALWVLMIHAEVMTGDPFMTHVFNRAAQYFAILIGLNGILWWEKRDPSVADWYRNRVRRLYPPMWGAVACWWVVALATNPPLKKPLGIKLLIAQLVGYLVSVGTGWFVTFAIAIAVLFPLFVVSVRRFGRTPVLLFGIACTTLTFFYRFELTQRMGFFDWMVFPPRLFADVAFGIFLASRIHRFGARDAAVGAALLVVYFGVPLVVGTKHSWDAMTVDALGLTDLSAALRRLTDIPFCMVLLFALQELSTIGPIAAPLAWLGNESYAMYLGQMLTHNALCFVFGFAELKQRIGGWGYVGLLLVGSLLWVLATIATRRAIAKIRSAD
jgi:peptidoglycan/LPS O-acetylase OafA/YrhL